MNNPDPFREAGDPLFGGHKRYLGTFGSNYSNACAVTLAKTIFEPGFNMKFETAQILEAGGWDCMVPIARWCERRPRAGPAMRQRFAFKIRIVYRRIS